MAVLPAPLRLDLQAVTRATGHQHLTLTSEAEVVRLFPDCEPGAMPPFGDLCGVPLYLDACLRDVPEIFFQAGNHREVIGMRYADYERVAKPLVGHLCLHAAPPRLTSRA